MISEGISDAAKPQFVSRFSFLEQRKDPLRALPLCGIEVEPCEGRLHSSPYRNYMKNLN